MPSPLFEHAAKSAARLALPCLLLGLTACETVPDGSQEPSAATGMLLAENSCASCHETFLERESPNPDAPAFREIVNRPGMTPDLLATWLTDGHNYPIEMGFRLEPNQVDSLVAYMIRQQSGEP
jgi:mono/diheme cytochrome c family protein